MPPLDVVIARLSRRPLTLDQALRLRDFTIAERQYELEHPSGWPYVPQTADTWGERVREVNGGVEPSDEEILAARAEHARRERELGT